MPLWKYPKNVGKAVVLQENRALQQDHALLQQNFEIVMDGEDVKSGQS